jgi:hypothetical protein
MPNHPTQFLPLAENRRRNLDLLRGWEKCPKLTPEQVEVVRCDHIGHGNILYTAYCAGDCFPIGFVVARPLNTLAKHLQVLHGYVYPACRRKGVRTAIHRRMIQDWDLISSPHGTADGEAWMRCVGYRYSPEQGHWEYRVSRKK